MKLRLYALWGITLIAATLAACNASSQQNLKPTSQAVARVNGDEITIHQVNYGLARVNTDETIDQRLSRKVAEQYIDQQLLLQKARESNVQRELAVMQTLDETRRQVLADAYLERAIGAVPPPDKAEVSAFYRDHPELFSQRKIYELQQVNVDTRTVSPTELDARLRGGIRLDRLTSWLESKRALLGIQTEVIPAEKVQTEQLPTLHGMKRGAYFISPKGDRHVVTIVSDFSVRPLSEMQMAPLIERYLVAQKRQAAGDRILKELRRQARIEWREDFEKPSSALTGEDTRPVSDGQRTGSSKP